MLIVLVRGCLFVCVSYLHPPESCSKKHGEDGGAGGAHRSHPQIQKTRAAQKDRARARDRITNRVH